MSGLQPARGRARTIVLALVAAVVVGKVVGPEFITRYNQFPSAQFNGEAAPGLSSGQTITAMEEISREKLPEGFGYEWSALSCQQVKAGSRIVWIFARC